MESLYVLILRNRCFSQQNFCMPPASSLSTKLRQCWRKVCTDYHSAIGEKRLLACLCVYKPIKIIFGCTMPRMQRWCLCKMITLMMKMKKLKTNSKVIHIHPVGNFFYIRLLYQRQSCFICQDVSVWTKAVIERLSNSPAAFLVKFRPLCYR